MRAAIDGWEKCSKRPGIIPKELCVILRHEMQASQTQPCSLATDQGTDKNRVGVIMHLELGSGEHRRLYVRVKFNFSVL